MSHNAAFSMSDVQTGAELFLDGGEHTPTQKHRVADFVDAAAEMVDGYELHLKVFALLLNGRKSEAADVLQEWLENADHENTQRLASIRAQDASKARYYEQKYGGKHA